MIWLTPASATLDEVVVHGYDPVWVIEEAVKKIPDNYSLENNRQTGFYREIAQKKRHYITVAEAIVDIYKTPYTDGTERDQIRIFKGRRLLSQKQGDTLAVKLQGGPNLFILADVVKNPEILLSKENLTCYDFRMEEAEVIGSRPQFVVSFRPRVNPPYALYYGKMYIDRERLAFSRIELNLSMDDKKEATEAILRKKPAGLRFKPLEAASIITYKYDGKVNYLNYVRNSLRFKCDWKRRLFSTNYTVLSETVMTDKVDNRISVPIGAIFHSDEIFSEKVSDFSDENFWGKYNIIEPTESLEDAVSKLKKLQ